MARYCSSAGARAVEPSPAVGNITRHPTSPLPSTPLLPPLPTSQAEIADLKQQVENLTARLNAAEGGGEAAG